MNNQIIVVKPFENEARADSRDIAQALGNQHRNVMSLIQDYAAEFEALGVLRFETEKPSEGSLGGRPVQYALLNEDQCYFLLTLVRNSELVVKLKLALVQAFREYRQLAAAPAPALPADPVLAQLETLMAVRRDQLALESRTSYVEQATHQLQERLDNAPIRMNSEMRARVFAAGKAFGLVHPRGFRGAWAAFKEAFGYAGAPLAKYDDLPASRFEEALRWLDLQIRTFGGGGFLGGD